MSIRLAPAKIQQWRFIIKREQRVVDHIAVVAGDIRSGPDRVRIFQVCVWNDGECATGPQGVSTPQDQEANAQGPEARSPSFHTRT